MRFIRVFVLVASLAGIFASASAAGGYTDDSYNTPVGTVGVPYSHTIAWKPGTGCPPYSYHLDAGNVLPPGLSLNSSSGLISGTPTNPGTYKFYVSQIDLCGVEGQGNSYFRIVINGGSAPPPPPPPPLSVNSSTLQIGEAGLGYSSTLSASGGSGAKTWSVTGGQLPAGLTLSGNGQISGTPTATGTFSFTVTVRSGASSASRTLTLTVVAGITVSPNPVIPTAEVRTKYSAALPTMLGLTGGSPPYHFAPVAGFPFGIGFDPATATIFGFPRQPGVVNLTVSITDSYKATKQVTLPLLVVPRIHVVPIDLHRGHVGLRFRAKIGVTGGKDPAWTITSGHLPAGLRLEGRTGVITGTPRRMGSFPFVVSVRDALGATVWVRYTLVIRR
jgi:large repetitive protein